MKKYLLLLLLLLVPFMVHAKDGLTVEKLEYVEKSELAEVLEDATFKDLSISINLRFHNLDDYVKYKITIKNDTNKDYDLNSEEKLTDYIKMKFEGLEKDDEILKANSTKTFYLIIYYAVPVPKEEFKIGSTLVYEETKTIDFSPKEVNPYTSTLPIMVISILVASGLTLTFFISKKKALKATMVVLIIATMFLPLRPTALEKITLDVNSKVEIKHPSFFFETSWPTHINKEVLFDEGMTWQEFLDSEYNTLGWTPTEYEIISHVSENNNGAVVGDHPRPFDNNKIGISTGFQSWGCNWYLTLDSFESLATYDETTDTQKYVFTDELIENGKTYVAWGNMC